jgi:hypothetical protein
VARVADVVVEAEAVVVTVAVIAAAAVAGSTGILLPAGREFFSLCEFSFVISLYRSDTEKKVNQGWGADEGNAELKAENAGENDAKAEVATPNADWETPVEGAEAAAPAEGEKAESRPPRVDDEDENTLTLDEYLKQQKEKELELVPKLETRKANEGDDSIWKDAVAVSKKSEDDDAYFVGKVRCLILSVDREY